METRRVQSKPSLSIHWGSRSALTLVAATGVEGSGISLNLGAAVTSRSGDSNRPASLVVSPVPIGAVLSDGTNKFKSTSGNTSVDIHAWNLSSLTITPTNDKNSTNSAFNR
jgi:hypothetical protein